MNNTEETPSSSSCSSEKRFLVSESSSLRDIFLSYSDKVKNNQTAMSSSPSVEQQPNKSSGSSADSKRPADSAVPSSSSSASSSAVKVLYLSAVKTEKKTPFTEKKTPFTEKKTPFTEQKTPFTEKKTPFTEQKTPFTEQKTPFTEKKTPFRRVRSPSRPRAWLSKVPSSAYKIPGFYKPRYHVHHHEYPFRKPGFHFGFRGYHHYPAPYFHRRDYPPPSALDVKREKDRIREREKERDMMKKDKDRKSSSPKKDSLTAPLTPLFPRSSSSREKDKQMSESDRAQSGERERGREREPSTTLSRITARNRAIQQKRKEIEEVYRQDCDTFAVVVRMLIAKDPSLEPTLQGSLQDNLRDIGHRCVEAMQAFIEEYDLKHSKDPRDPLL